MAELEHVAELDRRRHVRGAEVVACAAVNANGYSDAKVVHGEMVAPEGERALVAGVDRSRAAGIRDREILKNLVE